jgi:hypothetical protein
MRDAKPYCAEPAPATAEASSGFFMAFGRPFKKLNSQVSSGMLLTVVAILLGADPGSANASGKTPVMKNTSSDLVTAEPARTTPGARDPKIAVAEEFELARKRGTTEALELFILRHPDDPLAERALRLIKQVRDKRNNR